MTPRPPSSDQDRKVYASPVLKRYRVPEGKIEFYQSGTGVQNSIGCTDPDQCSGSGAAAPPPWMIPG